MRLGLFFTSMLLALILGIAALQVPRPRGTETPAVDFSAARAMIDIRRIAQAPHPVGTPDHDRVERYLIGRMTTLGLSPQVQTGPLSPEAIQRLTRWNLSDPNAARVRNLIGVLPGQNPAAPAVLLMAHYDTVKGSPGAADDTTGVASVLEAVRAIRARGPATRPLVVVFTDAEELNLDGARVFFSDHPLRDRIGAVVNLEARGGGGRATMFETGIGNDATIALFARAMRRADGGSNATSLAGYVYALTPNGTDFTIARDRRIGGVNLAFIGRPSQYHSPTATPDALDLGSVQNIGSQGLEAADALLRAPALPRAGANIVYADGLGRIFLQHSTGFGWVLLGVAIALFGFACWGARHVTRLSAADVGRGLLGGVGFVATGLVVVQAVRLIAGPLASRAQSADAYYTLLRRLPWMEGATVLAVVAVALAFLVGRDGLGSRVRTIVVAVAAVVATVVATALGGVDPVVLIAALIAIGLGLWSQGTTHSPWGQWLGLIALILVLALIGQALAPEAGFVFVWIALLASVAAAMAAVIDARLDRLWALVPAALATVIGGAWLAGLAHGVFLGIGIDLPGALVPVALLLLALACPLAPVRSSRLLTVLAAACLIVACGVAIGGRFAEPMVAGSAQTP